MKQCVVIGAAPPEDFSDIGEIDWNHAFVICADGGLDTARKNGIRPNLLIGDFDSLKEPLPEKVETIRLKVEKNDTDMVAAVRVGLSRGYRSFALLGALGGRPDHSFANFCVLQMLAEQGCRAFLAGRSCRVFLLTGGRLILSGMKGHTVSVFPFGSYSCTVSYEGLKYPLIRARLVSSFPLGVSNRIINDTARIILHEGNALIMVLF